MFRIIEKVNNAQKVCGKLKQFCHKDIPGAAMLTVASCSPHVLSEKNTEMRERTKEEQH